MATCISSPLTVLQMIFVYASVYSVHPFQRSSRRCQIHQDLSAVRKFETVSGEKAVTTEKSVERLEERREGMITTNDEMSEAATREIVVAKGWQIS
jgi:hypothetical protein